MQKIFFESVFNSLSFGKKENTWNSDEKSGPSYKPLYSEMTTISNRKVHLSTSGRYLLQGVFKRGVYKIFVNKFIIQNITSVKMNSDKRFIYCK